jgi:transposase
MKITDQHIINTLTRLKNHGETKQERIRSHAILLSHQGKTSKELAEIFSVSQRTIFQWFEDFNERGCESLCMQSGRGRKRLLDEEKDKELIKKQIELYPHQPKIAYAITLEQLQIKISYDTFKRFLKKHCI